MLVAVEWLKPDDKEPFLRRVSRDVQARLWKRLMLIYWDNHPREDLSFFGHQGSGIRQGASSRVETVTLPDGTRALHVEGSYVTNPRCPHDSDVIELPVRLEPSQQGEVVSRV